jgi:hypothetical protein
LRKKVRGRGRSSPKPGRNALAHLAAPLLAVAVLSFTTGCHKPEMQRCVDQQNTVVDDDLCHSNGEQRVLGRQPTASSSFRYYYGGTGSTAAGTQATGGSFMRRRDHTYAIAGKKRGPLEDAWHIVGIVALGALLFFAWEGRRKRV